MRFASRNENSKKNRGGAEGAFVGSGVDGTAVSVMVIVVVSIVDASVVRLAGFYANGFFGNFCARSFECMSVKKTVAPHTMPTLSDEGAPRFVAS